MTFVYVGAVMKVCQLAGVVLALGTESCSQVRGAIETTQSGE